MRLIALTALLLLPWSAHSQMYKCVDERGRSHFQDTPCRGQVGKPAAPAAAPGRSAPKVTVPAANADRPELEQDPACQRVRGLHALLREWQGDIEGWRRTKFLASPSPRLDGNCSERIRTLEQWKQVLENWRKVQVLDRPSRTVVQDCRQLVQMLARWRQVLGLWEGSGNPFLREPGAAMCQPAG